MKMRDFMLAVGFWSSRRTLISQPKRWRGFVLIDGGAGFMIPDRPDPDDAVVV